MKHIFTFILPPLAIIATPISSIAENPDSYVSPVIGTMSALNSQGSDMSGQYYIYEDSLYNTLFPQPSIEVSTGGNKNISHSSYSASFANPNFPTSISIDKSKAVGEINIISGTSLSGSKTYEVPIEVCSGIRGFQPEISLSYDSQGGNSIVGMGWQLSGVPVISRTSKNIYYDNVIAPIENNINGVFTLDGQRLIKTGSSDDCIYYQSEQGFIKAIGHISDNVTKYFEVFYPNGNKGIFGYESGNANRLSYPLTSLTNLDGNNLSYYYDYNDFHYTLKKITYNNGASVEFTYSNTRPDLILYYESGLRIKETSLLKSITCKSESNSIYTYTLTHDVLYGKSILSKIDLSASGSFLNPLRFYYGEGETEASYSSSVSNLHEYYRSNHQNDIVFAKGKFDYFSGCDGLITYPHNTPYWHTHREAGLFNHSGDAFLNGYQPDTKVLVYTNLSDNYPLSQEAFLTEDGFINVLCLDLEGNQEDYIVKINNKVVNGLDEITFKAYHAVPSGGISLVYTRKYALPTVYTDASGTKSIQPKYYYSGDFDGDGKMEILAVSCDKPFDDPSKPSKCYIFDIVNDKILCQEHVFNYRVKFVGVVNTDPEYCHNNTDRIIPIDYDGDGKTDLCHIDTNATTIYSFDKNGSVLVPRTVTTYCDLNRDMLVNRDLIPGDFNGDGKTDLMLSPASDAESTDLIWHVYNSMGKSGFCHDTFSGTARLGFLDTGFFAQDVNGDGTTDVIKYDSKNFYTYLCRNNNLTAAVVDVKTPARKSYLVPANIVSHGTYTSVICYKDSIACSYTFSRDENLDMALTCMVNSMGVIERNHYIDLDSKFFQYGTYFPGDDAVYPYVNIQEPISVLTASKTYLDGDILNSLRYDYENAVFHRTGLGFCGFSRITCHDSRGLVSDRKFNPYNNALPISEWTEHTESNFTFNVSVASNKIKTISLIKLEENDLLSGIHKTSSFTYDSYGYLLKETTSFSDGIIESNETTYIHNTQATSGYNLGFPITQFHSISSNGNTHREESKLSGYISAKRRPTVIEKKINGNRELKLTLTYDNNGNITKKSAIHYSSSLPLDTTFTFDTHGRVTSITDASGLRTEYSYDNFGRIATTKDFRGNSTYYTYDSFGRITKTILPDKNTIEHILSWHYGSEGLYENKTIETGKPTEIHIFDALNQETVQSQIRFDGSFISIAFRYDTRGNRIGVSLPYKSDNPDKWTNYRYDRFDRITEIEEPSGRTTSYNYSGKTVTTEKDNIRSTQTFDDLGRLVAIKDPAGTVELILRGDGQPISASAPGGVTTTFSYDGFGRRTGMDDPSLGNCSYSYDSYGNISKETKANGMSVTYTYDNIGRIIKKESPEITSTYTYTTGNLLAKVSANNGTSSEYGYDAYGNISFSKENAGDGIWLKKDYVYSNGNVNSIKYTTHTGFTGTEHYFYSNGHLYKGSFDSTEVFELISENEYGKPTEMKSYDDLLRRYLFNDYGMPEARIVSQGGQMKQALEYAYDYSTGNITTRKDLLRHNEEDFEYDDLNRLTFYGDAYATYDNMGNILSRGDVGSFLYNNPSNPYAVSGLNPGAQGVLLRDQKVDYTSFSRPSNIKENGYAASFIYNANRDRVCLTMTENSSLILKRYYLGDCYEIETQNTVPLERLYLFGNAYNASAVCIHKGTSTNHYNILRDNLGSITHVLRSDGIPEESLSYDAWGRLRDVWNMEAINPNKLTQLFLGRGYCGHEHLIPFNLINMNARLYDPIVGRFLSPDPHIQEPGMTQNFNRYSYALNNPLKYTDTDGEFFMTIFNFITDVIGNFWFNKWFNFKDYNMTRTKNAWKIDMGMFKGSFTQVLNKWTYGIINSAIGWSVAHFTNTFGMIEDVTYRDGMLALSGVTNGTAAFTIGHYSFGNDEYKATLDNSTFIHEYGHYIQSQFMGPTYLFAVAIPSIMSAGFTSKEAGMDHQERWFEANANRLSVNYFEKKYGKSTPGYDPTDCNYFNKEWFVNLKNNKGKTMFPLHKKKLIIWDFIL